MSHAKIGGTWRRAMLVKKPRTTFWAMREKRRWSTGSGKYISNSTFAMPGEYNEMPGCWGKDVVTRVVLDSKRRSKTVDKALRWCPCLTSSILERRCVDFSGSLRRPGPNISKEERQSNLNTQQRTYSLPFGLAGFAPFVSPWYF
jgi:hypothetical protein